MPDLGAEIGAGDLLEGENGWCAPPPVAPLSAPRPPAPPPASRALHDPPLPPPEPALARTFQGPGLARLAHGVPSVGGGGGGRPDGNATPPSPPQRAHVTVRPRYNIPPAVRESMLVLVRHGERQGAALEELEDEVRRLRRARGGPQGPSTAALSRQAQAAEQKLQRLEVQACDSLQHCAALRSEQKALAVRLERLERGGRSTDTLERLNGRANDNSGVGIKSSLEGRVEGLEAQLDRYIHGEEKGWREEIRKSRSNSQIVSEQLREELAELREELGAVWRRAQGPKTGPEGSGRGSPGFSPPPASPSFFIRRAEGDSDSIRDSSSGNHLRQQVDNVSGAVLQLQTEMAALKESLLGLDSLGVTAMPTPGGQSPMLAFSPQPGAGGAASARVGDVSRVQSSITLLSQVNMHSVQIESVIGSTNLNRQRIEDIAQRQQSLGQVDSSLAEHGHKIRRLEEKTADIVQNTYRRVDDHATAISRLSKGIQDNMQDRPTTMHVRHLIANSLAEDRLRILEKMGELQDEIANVEKRFQKILKKRAEGDSADILDTHQATQPAGGLYALSADAAAAGSDGENLRMLREAKSKLEGLDNEVQGLKQRFRLVESLPSDFGERLEESFVKIERTRLSCLQLEEAASCMVDRALLESTCREILSVELQKKLEEEFGEKHKAALDQLFQGLRSKVSLSDIDSLIEWKMKDALARADNPSPHLLEKVRKTVLQDFSAKVAQQNVAAHKIESLAASVIRQTEGFEKLLSAVPKNSDEISRIKAMLGDKTDLPN